MLLAVSKTPGCKSHVLPMMIIIAVVKDRLRSQAPIQQDLSGSGTLPVPPHPFAGVSAACRNDLVPKKSTPALANMTSIPVTVCVSSVMHWAGITWTNTFILMRQVDRNFPESYLRFSL